ncbi:MAG: type II CRISPR RNA-guided endonuclease Cas9 [Runella sp.]
MHHTIALDAGTNSTGFVLLDENYTLIEFGVDTFPMGNKEEKGVESSRNAERRGYRSARRNRFRYHLRRAKLLQKLNTLGMKPDMKQVITAYQLYELRHKALEQPINLPDLGRIFLLFNKYRGFKSSRKETSKDPDQEKEEGKIKSEISWLKSRMQALQCQTVGQYFFKMFEKSKELYERGEWHNPEEPYDERGIIEGQGFSLPKSRGIRREGRHLERALLEAEFDLIWEKQRVFYPAVLTDEHFDDIKNKTIFYQRPLKSPKKFIGKCFYEKKKQCAPLSSLAFQEFRVLKQLLDIRLTDEHDPDVFNKPLDDEQRGVLYEILQNQKKLSFKEVKEKLKLPKSTKINTDELGKDLLGNTTRAQIRAAVGDAVFDELLLSHRLEKLWHLLYFHQDENWLRKTLHEKWSFDPQTIEQLVAINLESGYANYSSKVLNCILPELKKGVHEREALKKAGYHVEQNPASRPLKNRISDLKNNELRNPVVEKATMRVVRLVNQLIKKHNLDPEHLTIRIESTRELKKPRQERQKIRTQNLETEKRRKEYADFLTKYGVFGTVHPDSIVIKKFELWLELGENKENLKEFQKFISGLKDYDLHIEKYRLWLEQGMKCPYTFRTIPLRDLMSPEIEIEHIIPYSRSMDNSFVNKTLCYAEANKAKSNRTAYEFMHNKGKGELEAFKHHIKTVFKDSKEKQKRFLLENVPDTFRPDQLTNTSYIARQIKAKLQEVSRDVQFTTGAATAELRRHWRIGGLLEEVIYEEQTSIEMWRHFANRHDPDNQVEIQKYLDWLEQFGKGKNRTDHRHHALDALVIGLCTPAIVQQISTFHRVREELKLANSDHDGKVFLNGLEYKLPKLPIHKATIRQALKQILVASQTNQRLLVTQKNRIKTKKGKHLQTVKSVRGALFLETFFGKIQKPHPEAFDKNEVFVTRKALTPDNFKTEKDLDKIVDVQVREILRRRLHKYDGKGEKAFSEEAMRQDPVYMYSLTDYPNGLPPQPSSKNGKPLPVIKKVRIISKNARSFVQLPAKDQTGSIVATNRYAEKDGNYIMALYELRTTDKKGNTKRICDFKLLSNPEAVQKRLAGTPLFADELTNDKGQTLPLNPLCPSLKKGDFVVFFENDPSEIQWHNREDLFRRLYQVTGLGSSLIQEKYEYGTISFSKHNSSKVNAKYVKGAFYNEDKRSFIEMQHTQIQAIKVKVNQLGEVVPLVRLT